MIWQSYIGFGLGDRCSSAAKIGYPSVSSPVTCAVLYGRQNQDISFQPMTTNRFESPQLELWLQ